MCQPFSLILHCCLLYLFYLYFSNHVSHISVVVHKPLLPHHTPEMNSLLPTFPPYLLSELPCILLVQAKLLRVLREVLTRRMSHSFPCASITLYIYEPIVGQSYYNYWLSFFMGYVLTIFATPEFTLLLTHMGDFPK